ncbi:hypothetical protein ALI144C_16465 [Actinosynnema sp. ALI-1.44]|uniref:Rv0361 family membrane protein n=1 Tax=Actinosynnema sp. ALI-1.44 TaxID=1933779 RepID=UPI00097C8D92|nr:hypothetical protein [Actinosynnema sp. ALI-1.44]ONI84253.1 hypothetical protein ALI144C_16465 [Actinosynnema sp. ALI-1.44]
MAEPEKPEADKPADTELSPPASKASKVRLIIAIGLAVLVLAGGGVALAIVASRPRPEDVALQQEKTAAREVAQKFATLLEQGRNDGAFALSKSEVKELVCQTEQDALEQEWQVRESKEIMRSYAPTPSSRMSITVKDVRIEGDKGRATLSGGTGNVRADQDYALVKESGGWKVCGVTFRARTSSTSSRPTQTRPSTTETPGSDSPTTPPTTTETTETTTGPTQ